MNYCTVQDIIELFRPLEPLEKERAEKLIPVVCDSLRQEAKKAGKDLDNMLENEEVLPTVAKSVAVDIVARTLMTSTKQEPMTQYTQSAMGYSVGGTFLNAGGGLFIKKSELARLGLKKQRYGVIEFD